MADWLQLPYDLIVLIANQLTEVVDFLSFSAVCRSWRLVYLNKSWFPSHRIPCLMTGEYADRDVPIRQFLSLVQFKVYRCPLPEVNGCRCWGSSLGWIVSLNQDFTICLINPLTRACLHLPQHPTLSSQCDAGDKWHEAIQKAVVIKVGDELVTMVMHNLYDSLSFAKHGDSDWTSVPLTPAFLVSIVSFKGKVWAVTFVGKLILIDIERRDGPRVIDFASPPANEKFWEKIYLVESSEDLLLILLYEKLTTPRFKVYKFDTLERQWMASEDLGNNTILMDNRRCVSVSPFGSFEPNHIYFPHDISGHARLPFLEKNRRRFMVWTVASLW